MTKEPYKPEDLNILILGHGRHGKDTLAQALHEKYGLVSSSSSEHAIRLNDVFFKIRARCCDAGKDGPKYRDCAEAYADRHNHRAIWFETIQEYNEKYGYTELATDLLRENNIYTGMRSLLEYEACLEERIFDLILWVDRGLFVEPESEDSFKIKFDPQRMHYINNNGRLEFSLAQAASAIETKVSEYNSSK